VEAGVRDRSDVLVEALVEHWKIEARKLIAAGVPIERVVEAMRTAALIVENEWFASLLQKAKDRMVAATTSSIPREQDTQAGDRLAATANQCVMPDAARVAIELERCIRPGAEERQFDNKRH
jgi:predicted ArsR family transcriptional regulator